MARSARTKRQRRGKGQVKRKGRRKANAPHKSRRKHHKGTRPATRSRKVKAARQKSQRRTRRQKSDRRLELAVRELNRGHSLTAAARKLGVASKTLQRQLKRLHLIARKGRRWVAVDSRLRRVTVMAGGRTRVLVVRGYKAAQLVGKHHHAVGEFVRTNDLELLKPFEGQAVQGANGRRYVLETDPNALHRIAAMDSPPFHEIYEIATPT